MTINYTHRTWAGLKARIICADFQHCANGHQPRENLCTIAAVLDLDITGAESLVFLTQDLRRTATSSAPWLTEYNPWEDVAIDTPVWCRMKDSRWNERHFAGLQNKGPVAWIDGKTSHTCSSDQWSIWDEMTLTNPNTNSEQS